MAVRYLLDTNILIDHLNGVSQAQTWLHAHKPELVAISVITRAEVLAGCNDINHDPVVLLLDDYDCFEITAKIADRAARLRREERWKLPDALQAAIALEHQLKLVTRNTKDFPPNRYSFVMAPYTI